MKKCIFLDRDGNINVEKDYLHKAEDFEFESGAAQAIKTFNDLGYIVIVVTNQSGVARGYYGEDDVIELHKHIDNELTKIGAKVDAYYYCPHHPRVSGKYGIICECRKPGLGMFLNAQEDFDIDFSNSIVVGDKISDIESAVRLGMKPVLVKTGHGNKELSKLKYNIEVFESLYDFSKAMKKS